MTDFITDHPVLIALVCSGIAIVYGVLQTLWLLRLPAGTERMQEIAKAVQEGASAYLRRQYTTIAFVAVVLFLVIGFWNDLGWYTAVGFLIGAVFSAAAGFIGMNVAVRANVRTAEAAKQGVAPALRVAFSAGSVTGLLVVGLGLLGVAGYYGVLVEWFDQGQDAATQHLIGLAFGGSLISVFARLGGGIYTKAADVGADLVGKVEAGIPEDDPRNPAVIADNVGDNVGDCAGMAADLFETYAVTLVAVMFLGAVNFPATEIVHYPLVIGAVAILASVAGTFFARIGRGGSIMAALYKAVIASTVISALLFIPVTAAFDGDAFTFWELYGATLIGLAITFLLVAITEFYTGTRWGPVKGISRASLTGHATNIIEGLAIGMQATALPVIVIAAGIVGAFSIGDTSTEGLFYIGIAVMAQLVDDWPHRRPRRLRPGDRQRGRHRGDGRPGRVRPCRHRPAGRRRQHDEGGHEGLRDRVGRSRRADPLRRFHDRAERRGPDGHPLRARRRLGDRRPLPRRPDALPLLVTRDAGRGPRRRPGRGGGAASVPRDPWDPRGHRPAGLQPRRRHRHRLGDQEHDAPEPDPGRLSDHRRDHQRRDARRAADRDDRHWASSSRSR